MIDAGRRQPKSVSAEKPPHQYYAAALSAFYIETIA
jgi:hypothetical protein